MQRHAATDLVVANSRVSLESCATYFAAAPANLVEDIVDGEPFEIRDRLAGLPLRPLTLASRRVAAPLALLRQLSRRAFRVSVVAASCSSINSVCPSPEAAFWRLRVAPGFPRPHTAS
jgi:hypothetical protein